MRWVLTQRQKPKYIGCACGLPEHTTSRNIRKTIALAHSVAEQQPTSANDIFIPLDYLPFWNKEVNSVWGIQTVPSATTPRWSRTWRCYQSRQKSDLFRLMTADYCFPVCRCTWTLTAEQQHYAMQKRRTGRYTSTAILKLGRLLFKKRKKKYDSETNKNHREVWLWLKCKWGKKIKQNIS